MSYAPYTNDRLKEGQGRILGEFKERYYGNRFEYAERGDLFPADFLPDLPHVVFVADGQARLAHVKKTVLSMAVDDDAPRQQWQLRSHRIY